MNRELKFRTWFKPHNGWINSVVVGENGHIFCYTVTLDEEEKEVKNRVKHNVVFIKDGDAVIEFWTGLQDSTGRDIYDGDIVQHKVYPDVKSVVVFGRYRDNEQEYHRGWYYQKIGSESFNNGWLGNNWEEDDDKETKTIIGNIHENPELLK
jgi:uncharacterized phage protein (TIGR01671 family)